MKVDSSNSSIQLSAYLKQVRNQQTGANSKSLIASGQSATADKVQLSERALEVQQAGQMLKEMPDIREEKVEQVKSAVNQGTYQVAGAKVATGMMRESFENSMILQKIDTRA